MRGRGFVLRSGPGSSCSVGGAGAQHGSGSSGAGGGGGRPDLFRSRPLNTSRPPSLHVDDFTKLVKDDNVIEVCYLDTDAHVFSSRFCHIRTH